MARPGPQLEPPPAPKPHHRVVAVAVVLAQGGAVGVKDWFRGRADRSSSSTELEPAAPPVQTHAGEPGFSISIQVNGFQPLVELTGTTTFGKAAVETLIARRGLQDRSELVTDGVLQREPTNPADPAAVMVLIEGERIGYLPGYATGWVDLSDTGSQVVPLQLFTTHDGTRRWNRAWVWLAAGAPEWTHSQHDLPPLTSAEKRVDNARRTEHMVDQALSAGGARADQFAAGMVEGRHYLELVEPINELKRQGRLEEALQLCYRAIDGAEHDLHNGRPAPWYTEQAAIVHRKLKQHDQELAVLRRWLRHVPEIDWAQTTIGQRLQKLQAKRT